MSKGKGVSGNTHSRSQLNNYANQNNPNNSANRANNNNRSNQMNPNNSAYHQSRNGNGKNGKYFSRRLTNPVNRLFLCLLRINFCAALIVFLTSTFHRA